MNRFMTLLCLGAIALGAIAAPSHAAVGVWTTWTGANGTDFSDATNWDPALDVTPGNWNWLRVDDNSDATSPVLNSIIDPTTMWLLNNLYVGSYTAPNPIDGDGNGYATPTTHAGKLTIGPGGDLHVSYVLDIAGGEVSGGASSLVLDSGKLTVDNWIATRMGFNGGHAVFTMKGTSLFQQTNGGELQIGVNDAGALSDTSFELNMSDYAHLLTSAHYRLGDNASFGGTGLVAATGAINMTGNAHVENYNRQVIIGHGKNATGSVTLNGDGLGNVPVFEQKGSGCITWIGVGGGTGTLSVTNALYHEDGYIVVGNGGGDATLSITTTPGSYASSTVESTAYLLMSYNDGNSTSRVNVSEGSYLNVGGWFGVGYNDGAPGGNSGSAVVTNNGTIYKSNNFSADPGFLIVGRNSAGTINQNAGSFTDDSITCLGQWGNTGTLNLNGGVFSTGAIQVGYWNDISAKGIINFDGGTLQVNSSSIYLPASGLVNLFNPYQSGIGNAHVYVKNGGAIIDTSGWNALLMVPFEAAPGSTGGLTKRGSGVLNIYGANTYTGATTIEAGDLFLALGASLATTGVTVPSFSTLTVSPGVKLTGVMGTVSFSNASTLNLALDSDASVPVFNVTKSGSGALNLAGGGSGMVNLYVTAGGNEFAATPYTLFQYNSSTGNASNLNVTVDPTIRSLSVTPTTVGNAIKLTVTYDRHNLVWNPDAGSSGYWMISGDSTAWKNPANDTFYNLDDVSFTDAGAAFPTVVLAGAVRPRSIVVNNSAGNDYWITDMPGSPGNITGAGTTFTKNGAGKVTFNNSGVNDFTGDVTVNEGTLAFSSGSQLGVNNTTHVAGGTLAHLSGLWVVKDQTLTVTSGTVEDTGPTFVAGWTASRNVGVVNMTGGVFNKTNGGEFYVGVDGGTGIMQLGGDAVMNLTGNWVSVGCRNGTGSLTLSGNARLNAIHEDSLGGEFLISQEGGAGTLTVSENAVFNVPRGFVLGQWGGTGTVNLDGGTTIVAGIASDSGVINLNGGVLQAVMNVPDYLNARSGFAGLTVNVKDGGAKFDTNGFDIGLKKKLSAASASGGLTKLGAGTLALSALNTYNGPTVIQDGSVQLQAAVGTQAVYTADNAAGNRSDGPYSLGRNFTVSAGKSIQVTQLGVFDDLGDGLVGNHTVHITNLTTGVDTTAVASFAPGDGTYKAGFRFVSLATPAALSEGNYKVWVDSIGGGNDVFADNGICGYDAGTTEAVTFGNSYYSVTVGHIPDQLWGANDADASFIYYDPSTVVSASVLPRTTPVLLGGGAGSTPTLDLKGGDLWAARHEIASLADVVGATVKGVVTNSAPSNPVVLILNAPSGTTTFSGTIEGNLSLVKDGGSTQILTGALNYAGDTTVNAGILQVSAIDTPLNAVYVADSAMLTASSITADSLTIGGPVLMSAAINTAPVPEPGTLALLALAGLGALLAWRRK